MLLVCILHIQQIKVYENIDILYIEPLKYYNNYM